jgi:hypothetical protein
MRIRRRLLRLDCLVETLGGKVGLEFEWIVVGLMHGLRDMA